MSIKYVPFQDDRQMIKNLSKFFFRFCQLSIYRGSPNLLQQKRFWWLQTCL